MKNLVAIISGVLLTLATAAFFQDKDLVAESGNVLVHIREGRFKDVAPFLDSLAAVRMDSSRIRKAWENVVKSAGEFQNVINVTTEEQPNYHIIYHHCQFERKKVDFKVAYSTVNKIRSMSFVPAEIREQYTFPPYYNPALFRDTTIIIQSGKLKLPGILSLPVTGNQFPLVILVHGSGPNDKDETVGPTKIFKDIAVGLVAKGIAVFRYDKRSRVYPGKTLRSRTLTAREEITDDVAAVISQLKNYRTIDSSAIYVCGHSFGGMMLPKIASDNKIIRGLIYLCPNARPLEDLLIDQAEYIASVDTTGRGPDMRDSVSRSVRQIRELKESSFGDSTFIFNLPVSYWIDLKKYDPLKIGSQLRQPMLFLQGGRDYQVGEKDLNLWKKSLEGTSAEFKIYPSLNHFFIKGKGKSTPSEYTRPGNVDVEVIEDMVAWIFSAKTK